MRNRHIVLMGTLILSLILISGGFFAGYMMMQNWFAVPEEVDQYISAIKKGELPDAIRRPSDGSVEAMGSDVRVNGAPVRLDLYVAFAESQKPAAVVIGKLDGKEGTAKLITVPQDAKITLSDERYKLLSAEFPALPQLFQLKVLPEYVGKDKIKEVLAGIFEELFSCRFDGVWEVKEEEWLDCSGSLVRLAEKEKEFLDLPSAGRQTLRRLQEFEACLAGNGLSMKKYAETVAVLEASDIVAERISGVQEAEGYYLDMIGAARQLRR